MKLTANFSKAEFDSKDGAQMPNNVLENIKKVAKNLQVLRDYFGASIKINSGYRSPSHNAKVGGVKNSQHVLGTASDIVVSGKSPKEVANAIIKLQNEGKMAKGGVGLYDTFVHYDIYYDGKTLRRWDNSKKYNFK